QAAQDALVKREYRLASEILNIIAYYGDDYAETVFQRVKASIHIGGGKAVSDDEADYYQSLLNNPSSMEAHLEEEDMKSQSLWLSSNRREEIEGVCPICHGIEFEHKEGCPHYKQNDNN